MVLRNFFRNTPTHAKHSKLNVCWLDWFRTTLSIALLMLVLSACGAPASVAEPVTVTTEAETPVVESFTDTPSASPIPSSTASPLPTSTPEPPTPTETPMPTLELPAVQPNLPARIAWTGLPSYAGDSEPGYLFRVDYDPETWAQTVDNFDSIVLAHRDLPSCVLTAFTGHGLPLTWKVETEFRQEGNLFIETNTVLNAEKIEFVTFVISDKRITTGFRLEFLEQSNECIQAAEQVLLTLRSFSAQPTITPTP